MVKHYFEGRIVYSRQIKKPIKRRGKVIASKGEFVHEYYFRGKKYLSTVFPTRQRFYGTEFNQRLFRVIENYPTTYDKWMSYKMARFADITYMQRYLLNSILQHELKVGKSIAYKGWLFLSEIKKELSKINLDEDFILDNSMETYKIQTGCDKETASELNSEEYAKFKKIYEQEVQVEFEKLSKDAIYIMYKLENYFYNATFRN